MDSKKQVYVKGMQVSTMPKIKYDTWFKLFGLVTSGLDVEDSKIGAIKSASGGSSIRRIYRGCICMLLWFVAFRSIILMAPWPKEYQIILGDITSYWNDYRQYYLIPMAFYSLHAAITVTIFIKKEQDLTWLVPFLSLKQLQATSPRVASFHPSNYKTRINIAIIINLAIISLVTVFGTLQYYKTMVLNFEDHMFWNWMPWLVVHGLWFFYVTGIEMFSMTYFNLVSVVLTKRFRIVCRDIEALAETGDNGNPGSKNNALTQLYFEHNEVCELVDESNHFWNGFMFFTYMCYIPCACYELYNLFFAEFDDLLGTVIWSLFLHGTFVIGFLSISAADVSAQAHAPYTALHTLSLLQLPIDLEVNMSTFLHRVRGPTIGFSCLDLFVVTNASISNTIAACASYFLIVADFSRSTVAANEAAKAEEAKELTKSVANAAINATATTLGLTLTTPFD